jgi:hypothetical protein
VLLALADACSRDDGTGCWPSAATVARKANISERTVRRVIARLEADGQLVVHRGGGRAGATNSYTVVAGIHSPGQSVTPDNLPRGDTGDRPPLTQLRQGTPDTSVSPDPPHNHQGTTAAVASGGEAGEFFAALPNVWRLTQAQRTRLAPAAKAALDLGWRPQTLASVVGANATGVRNQYAVLATRLSPAELVRPARPKRPPWYGECDQATRMLDFHDDVPPRARGAKAPQPTVVGGTAPCRRLLRTVHRHPSRAATLPELGGQASRDRP